MKTASRVMFLALPLLACAASGPVVAADPTPAELLKEYQALGLPLPPETAKLVRYDRATIVVVNGKEQPPSFGLAFEVKPGTKTERPVLWGFEDAGPLWAPRVRGEVKPDRDAAKDVELRADDALTLAIQCQARGWTELAEALLERSQKDAKKTPKQRLVGLAWGYWTKQAAHPTVDRAPVAKRLKVLIEQHVELDTKDNRELLRSLELAFVPGKAKPGSVEALIDALVDYHADGPVGDLNGPFNDPYWRIAVRGFDAVPALIEHLGDDRLTRSMMHSSIRSWSRNMCVGDVVDQLLKGLAVDTRTWEDEMTAVRGIWRSKKASAAEWWEKAQKQGEETYLLEHIFSPPPKAGERTWVNIHMLRVIVTKYPKNVPDLYRTVLDKRPEFYSDALVEVLAEGPAPAKDKLDLLLYAAKHKDYEHQRPALGEIKKLDPKRFDTLLLATIEGFPKDVQVEYWKCNEAAIARLAIESGDPRVWPALEKVTKRSELGLRMELLLRYEKRDDPRWRAERLRFLAAFLDDSELRDLAADKRFDGPCAGFNYDRIEVRDFVAIELGWQLGIEVERKRDRTPAEWAEIREKVRGALKRELDKPK